MVGDKSPWGVTKCPSGAGDVWSLRSAGTRPAGGAGYARSSVASLVLLLVLTSACEANKPAPTGPCRQQGDEKQVACGDFKNSLGTVDRLQITGRLVYEEPGYNPLKEPPSHDLSQDEIDEEKTEIRLLNESAEVVHRHTLESDDEGYVNVDLDLADLGLPAGHYSADVFTGSAWATRLGVRLLPKDYAKLVVISDVDMTYLETDFHGAEAIAELLEQSAEERTALPGMEQIYQGLREGSTQTLARPLLFLSGSPLFFRRTLQGRMSLDQFQDDGVALKPFKLLLMHQLLEGLEEEDLWQAALAGDWARLFPSIADQVGYKLTGLFSELLRLPATTRLLVMGDDTESDVVVYNLLHRFTAGELDEAALDAALSELEVDELWHQAVGRLAPAVRAHRGTQSPIAAIYINQTEQANQELPVSGWELPEVTRVHRGAWPLALDAYEEGWFPEARVKSLKKRLLALGHTASVLTSAAENAVQAGYLGAEVARRF